MCPDFYGESGSQIFAFCFLLLFNRPITILNGLVCVPSANLKEVQNAEPEGNLCDYKLKMLSSV